MMKYWVKCKVFENHELKNNEFVLVPDGIDAENKEEAIALCIEFIHMREKENGMNSSVSEIGITSKNDDLERNYIFFSAYPILDNHKVLITNDENSYAFLDEMNGKIKEMGYNVEKYENAIIPIGSKISMGVDTWIVDIRQSNGETATINLFHKNNIIKNKGNSCKIPDYHKQTSGVYTVDEIIYVMKEHINKWKARCK